MNVTIEDLLQAGVQFGHQLKRWNPRSKPFIYDNRNGMSIIDIEKTHAQLEKACQFLEEWVASGKNILLLGTKRQAKEIVREAAVSTEMPFCVERWLGGTLTNFSTIKNSLEKYRRFMRADQNGDFEKLGKKEVAAIRRRLSRMHRNFEGLVNLDSTPKALFVVDTKLEYIAVAEARRMKIPVIALVDTNADPTMVDYPIVGNDDSLKSVRIIVGAIQEAIQNGLARRQQSRQSRSFQSNAPVAMNDGDDSQPEVVFSPDIFVGETTEAPAYSKPAAKSKRPFTGKNG